MMVVTRGAYSPAGFSVVLLLHGFVVYLLLRESPPGQQVSPNRYSRLLFITLPPAAPATKTSVRRENVPVAKSQRQIIAPPAPVVPAEKIIAENPLADIVEEAPRLDIDNLIKGAAKADRETRGSNELQAYGPAPDSMEAVMTRAFTAAKLAVPLKWYEAARIELFSAPNDPKQIYQVKTAFGTYCLYYPSMYEEVGGGAAARQPRISSCPRRFGAGAK